MPLSLPHTQLPPVHQNDSHSPPRHNQQLSHTHIHTRRPQTPPSRCHDTIANFFPFPSTRWAALPPWVCRRLPRASPAPRGSRAYRQPPAPTRWPRYRPRADTGRGPATPPGAANARARARLTRPFLAPLRSPRYLGGTGPDTGT